MPPPTPTTEYQSQHNSNKHPTTQSSTKLIVEAPENVDIDIDRKDTEDIEDTSVSSDSRPSSPHPLQGHQG